MTARTPLRFAGWGKDFLGFLKRNDMLPWVMGVSVFVALSVALWAILSPEEAGLGGLILLAGVAILFFIGFYGLATGALAPGLTESRGAPLRIGAGRLGEAAVFMRVLETAPEAYLVTTRAGAVIYANSAYEDLTRAGHRGRNMGRPLPLEQVFVGDEDLAAPLYRLARAARRGVEASETLRFKRVEGDVRLMHATVSPLPGDREHVVWRIAGLAGDGTPIGGDIPVRVDERQSDFALKRRQGAEVVQLEVDAAGRDPQVEPAVRSADSEPGPRPVPAVSPERFAHLFANAPVGIAIVDAQGVVTEANAAFEAVAREGERPVVGTALIDLVGADDRQAVADRLEDVAAGEVVSAPLDVAMGAGEGCSVQLYASAIVTPAQESAVQGKAMIVYLIDMTEQKALKAQFTQSQKMQAVGQLAGGVAHDFNNLLTAIIGFCDLLLTRHQVGDPSFADIDQIRQNANRAANLVRQLLAFSRQQTLTQKILAPTDVLTDLSMLLRRLLGEKVDLKLQHGRDLGLIKVDQSQLDTALINLAVNARDAMPDGGVLTIRTSNWEQAEPEDGGGEIIAPGRYVKIEVADTGCGIAPENLDKIFEPFFTTKGVGEGTGLGLSTVYGIIKQMGGYVFLDSEVGKGTTFRIYLPVYVETEEDRRNAAKQEVPSAPRDLTGMGTILLVEDEDAVRAFAKRALTSRGYTVLEAPHGEKALEVFREYEGDIDLLISDVVMPEMDGPTLAKHVRDLRPHTKMIFVSGYAEDVFKKSMDRPEDIAFLPKPFSLKQLVAKVKEVLNG